MGRPALTFNGEPATIPPPLPRTSAPRVSFLLEEDRARALIAALPDRRPPRRARPAPRRRWPGGQRAAPRLPRRLGAATPASRVDHRASADAIEAKEHTPGARLTNARPDAIHAAFVGARKAMAAPGEADRYDDLIRDELEYKAEVFDAALACARGGPRFELREVPPGDRGRRPGRLAPSAAPSRIRPRPLRPHLPLLAQRARPDDRGRRECAAQLLAL